MNIYLNFAVKEDLFETTKPTNQRSPITKYHPFGMGMEGRGFTVSGEYRYGFNTQEKVPELGNAVTSAEFWVYDGKLGRRWNVDPKGNFSISLYACHSNNPILLVDINGDSAWFYYQAANASSSEWHWHAEVNDNLKLKTGEENGEATYTYVKGYQNLLVASGNVSEAQYGGQVTNDNSALYTFYAKDGTTKQVYGFTLASDDYNRTSIDEGIYTIKREPIHRNKTGSIVFEWRVLNSAGIDNIPCRDGMLNKNAPSQVNTVIINGQAIKQGYKTEIYLHSSSENSDGSLIINSSTGCQTIRKDSYKTLSSAMAKYIHTGESFTFILTRRGGTDNPDLPIVKEYVKEISKPRLWNYYQEKSPNFKDNLKLNGGWSGS